MASYDEIVDKYSGLLPDTTTGFSTLQIEAAAAVVGAKTARDVLRHTREVESILRDIRSDIRALGTDGLHLILKEHARKIRAAKSARLKRLRRKRRRAKEAQR